MKKDEDKYYYVFSLSLFNSFISFLSSSSSSLLQVKERRRRKYVSFFLRSFYGRTFFFPSFLPFNEHERERKQ